MATMSFDKITNSRPLLFQVGEAKREFWVHSSLFGSLSPPLNQLVEDPWSELASNAVQWENVDEATFVHLVQFAYTGGYHVESTPQSRLDRDLSDDDFTELDSPPSETQIGSPPSPPSEGSSKEVPRAKDSNLKKKKKNKKKISQSIANENTGKVAGDEPSTSFSQCFRSVFQKLLADKRPKGSNEDGDPEVAVSEVTKCYSYSEIFLTHIRLYVFANCYQIDKLAELALANLHESLVHGNELDDDALEVVEFYVVAPPMPAPLQEILLAYIASKASALWRNVRFQELLHQDRGMMAEIFGTIMKATRS